ncbi:MAG: Rieske 2Fe-2S domain-containing protein [Acidobacteriota bacterium]
MTGKSSDQGSVPPDGRPYHDQPQWRNDFPIDLAQDDLVSRRDFTKFLVLTSFAFAAGQVWIVFENWRRRRRGRLPIRKIAAVNDMAVGSSLIFSYPDAHDDCIVVRTGSERFVAYSQKCTHLSCAVIPEPQNGRLVCPCHHGLFDLATGNVLAGPPRRPLPRVRLEIRDGALYATGVEVRA